jgi:hypothetical protein
MPSKCAEAEAGEIGASDEEDQGGVCAVQRPARIAQVSSDEDTRAKGEKTECESTEELPTMPTVTETAPRCRGPAHDDRGGDCDCFDQETLAIGARPTSVKELPASQTFLSRSRAPVFK